MGDLQTKILRFLRSPQCFAAILLLFFIESAWIAVSAAYPMVFDENVHFGVIQLYAHQWSPFISSHSTYLEPFGALSRDPSFLYRWLLSFPYRLIALVTGDQMMQVIDLRFINIFMFGGGLVIFWRLFKKTRVSPAVINVAFLFFVLIPVVPLLAGQINYDNGVMLVTALSLLLAVAIAERLNAGRLPVTRLVLLAVVCLLGSLVQYEFLPIALGICLWLLWKLPRGGRLVQMAREAWNSSNWRRKALPVLALVVALSLWLPLYGVNLAHYHTPTPSCDQVLGAHLCRDDANWTRVQNAIATRGHVNTNPVLFAGGWAYRMLVGMFYTSSGGAGPDANYLSVNPLPVSFAVAVVVVFAGAALLVYYRGSLIKHYRYFGFLAFVSGVYGLTLLLHNYSDYLHYGQKFAINARYLLPITLPCMVVLALGLQQALKRRRQWQLPMAAAVLLLLLQGGGALMYITVSNPNWYWQNKVPVDINKAAQTVVRPLIIFKSPLKNVTLNQPIQVRNASAKITTQ